MFDSKKILKKFEKNNFLMFVYIIKNIKIKLKFIYLKII